MKGLKIILWVCAVSYLLCFVYAVLPFQAWARFSSWFGLQFPAAEPITEAIFRLCLAMFGMVGIFFVILARNPLKYGAMLILSAWGLLGYGAFTLVVGILYAFPAWAYADGIIGGFVAGALILIFRRNAMQTGAAEP